MDGYEIMKEQDNIELVIDATTDVIAAYISNNKIEKNDLAPLIQETFGTFKSLVFSTSYTNKEKQEPAVPIAESVTDDYIVCLEDGKKLKMLKRHLKSTYNMSPEQYRERWSLPSDYPMVAPNYAARRSKLAKEIGLGKNRTKKPDLSIAA